MRHRNFGLIKRCRCKRTDWPRCSHGWHFSFKTKGGPRWRLSLDVELGRHVESKTEAYAEADRMRTAIRNGTFRKPSEPACPVPSVTIEQLGESYFSTYTNPKTGEPVDIPAKSVPYFKPGKELKELINGKSGDEDFDDDELDEQENNPGSKFGEKVIYISDLAADTLRSRLAGGRLIKAFEALYKKFKSQFEIKLDPRKSLARITELEPAQPRERPS